MRICIIAEGSYPYVVGGVSAWIDMVIRQMPEHEFIIQTIAVSREDAGSYQYELPENVIEIREAFLNDEDIKTRGRRVRLTKRERAAVKSFIYGEKIDWPGFFNFFLFNDFSVNDFIMGKDFLEIVTEFADDKFERSVYSNFIWTYRSMMLPLCILLKNKLPEADLYHSVSTGYAGIMGSMAKYAYQKPFVVTEHGIYTRERMEDIIRSDWTQGIYKDIWIEHFYKLSDCAYQYADTVTALFQKARELQIEIGCPADKTGILPNGIKVEEFLHLKGKDPAEPAINVGTVARVTPIKDIKTMISAFAYAKKQLPALRLYIMGPVDEDKDYYQECLDLIAMMEVADVIFTGRVNVKDYIGQMDIAILTSISEGQPLSILEFMAAARPCIATNVGCCEELILGSDPDREQPCGIITPILNVTKISEAILKLAGNPKLREEMGQAGRERVSRQYNNQLFLKRMHELYNEQLIFEDWSGGAVGEEVIQWLELDLN